ncbi:hypothetical protein K474DRAFT_1609843 [Panus rudis PR-1116 ss-1]|nr:hypothetical protein K474DRAFT_1609843 [Panus rudis PR-1116 ss-1]
MTSRNKALRSIPLRVVRPVIGGSVVADCILDPGSMIVTMREDVWKKTGRTLHTEDAINLHSANTQVDRTVGEVHDLEFDFEGVKLYLQVQVVKSASYEVILGRPFFCLASCQSFDQADGDQVITITDPEKGTTITIPTFERRFPATKESQEGF